MSARKRRSKYGIHEALMSGKTNTAAGTWVSQADKAYMERGARNRSRNVANGERAKRRRSKVWERAYSHAKEVLKRDNDNSEPLNWFVQEHMQKGVRRGKGKDSPPERS